MADERPDATPDDPVDPDAGTVPPPEREPAPRDETTETSETATSTRSPDRSRKMLVPAVVVSSAFLLNVVGMAFTVHSLRASDRRLSSRFDELENATSDDSLEGVDGPIVSGGRSDTAALREMAAQLERRGQHGEAARLRGLALRLDGIERQEWGYYKEAQDELRGGRTRLARRRLYQILARRDEPGARWAQVADAARFDIGITLVTEADAIAERESGEGDAR